MLARLGLLAQLLVTPALGPPLERNPVFFGTSGSVYTAGTGVIVFPPPLGSIVVGGGTYRVSFALTLVQQGTAGTITPTITCDNGTLVNTFVGPVALSVTAPLGTEADATLTCTLGPAGQLRFAQSPSGVTGVSTPGAVHIRLEWLP